jgi:hypothetical protein
MLYLIMQFGVYAIGLCGGLHLDGVAILDSHHDLFGELHVAFGSARLGIVEESRLSMAGSFGETNVAGNRRLVEKLAKEVLELGGYALGKVGAVVIHGEDDAFDEKAGIQGLSDAFDGIEELAYTFEGEILGLHGDEYGIGGDEGVQREEVECRRTVEDDDFKLLTNLLEGVAEAVFAIFGVDQLDIGSDEVLGRGNHLELLDGGGLKELRGFEVSHEKGVGALAIGILLEAEAGGGVGLGVAIDEEGVDAAGGEAGG